MNETSRNICVQYFFSHIYTGTLVASSLAWCLAFFPSHFYCWAEINKKMEHSWREEKKSLLLLFFLMNIWMRKLFPLCQMVFIWVSAPWLNFTVFAISIFSFFFFFTFISIFTVIFFYSRWDTQQTTHKECIFHLMWNFIIVFFSQHLRKLIE